MIRRKTEFDDISNHELLEKLSHDPAPINLHLYQPPRLLNVFFAGRESTLFDITGITGKSDGFNHRITRESYLPLLNKQILTNENISWNLYGVTADWLEIHYPQFIDDLRYRIDAGAKPPVGDTYLHVILPFLSREHQDMLLNISKQVYRQRWGVDPETVWLPESAADSNTLSSLAKNNFAGVHLREYQVQSTSGSNLFAIDTRYGKILAITSHNYLSGKIGFDKPWSDSFYKDWRRQSELLGYAPRISIDGETLGHWWKEGDGSFEFTKYLLRHLDSSQDEHKLDFTIKNIPKARLVENTSWSCLDTGLGRWKGDSHCRCGLPDNEQQANQIRTSKKDLFSKLSLATARIDQVLDNFLPGWREVYIQWFLSQRSSLATGLPISAEILKDKTIEKLFLSAYIRDMGWTSCGWFFGDVNGFERQIPANSLRAIAEIMSWPDIIPNH
ncbi:MAG: Glycoside hydrolase, family 57 [Microgenomates group bacterium GW2011_GWC1_44_10]|nr:MAG: Glycoside hydrolase, family 57 [Microgenomates group bacterium GW2011_GWC1_44_10]